MTNNDKSLSFFEPLLEFVKNNDGYIHPSLILNPQSSYSKCRGIETTSFLKKDELLIRIPLKIVINGEIFGDNDGTESNTMSPWLRCVIILIKILFDSSYKKDDEFFSSFLASLPTFYETITMSWSKEDLNFLQGTTLGRIALLDREERTTRKRFDEQVATILEVTFDDFLVASACVSTRGFNCYHQQKPSSDMNGPFLIPFVDLINHGLKEATNTSLQYDDQKNAFYMVADDNIKAGEEILHSYGDLTSCQLLQTFGFIPRHHISRLLQNDTHCYHNLTSALISRQTIIKACATVAEEYSFSSFHQHDEQWNLKNEWDKKVQFIEKYIPEQFLVTTDTCEIITCCTILFLPDENAIRELFPEEEVFTLLEESVILQDVFLGIHTCQTIIHLINEKQKSYTTECIEKDKSLVRNLLNHQGKTHKKKQIEGLVIQLEEKMSLVSFRKKICSFLQTLLNDNNYDCEEFDNECKRRKQL